jgi:hypothetical protein
MIKITILNKIITKIAEIVPPTDLSRSNRLPTEKIIKVTRRDNGEDVYPELTKEDLNNLPHVPKIIFQKLIPDIKKTSLENYISEVKREYKNFWENLDEEKRTDFKRPSEFNAQFKDFIDGDIIVFEYFLHWAGFYEEPIYVYEKDNRLYIYPMDRIRDDPDDPFPDPDDPYYLLHLPKGTIERFGETHKLYPSVNVIDYSLSNKLIYYNQ